MYLKNIKRVLFSKLGPLAAIAVLLSPLGLSALLNSTASATAMTTTSVVETNMNSSAASNLYINFKAGAADSASTFTIVFSSGYTLASSGLTVVSSAACTGFFGGGSTVAGTLTAAGNTGTQTITISGITGSLTSGTEYCFYISGSPVTNNPSTAGNYTSTLADGGDTQVQGVDIIAAGTGDQIVVTAAVTQFFTLTFGANVDSMSGATPSTYASSGGVTLTVNTNAVSGWGLWAEDAGHGGTAELYSTTTTAAIPSVATGALASFQTDEGSPDYGMTVSNVTGTAAAETNYNGTSTAYNGSGLSTTAYTEFADATATGTGTAKVKELMDVSSTTTNASDYQDTITIVGDGRF